VPRRNDLFSGREPELALIERKLDPAQGKLAVAVSGKESPRSKPSGWGVGKTQLAIEYCHRSFPHHYSLVIWLRAESSDLIAHDFRRLAADVGIDVMGKRSSENNQEIRARLYHARYPWLIVFENLESAQVVNDFIPRGYTDSEASCGHVLVTCRRNFPEWQDSCVTLDCFEKHEALQFLYRAVGRSDDEKTD